jgi:chitinase
MSKRDGSHWELFDCNSRQEERQKVRAICTDDSPSSNCGDIYLGAHGVASTVVILPEHCGAIGGEYAMAVELKPSQDQTMPHKLYKRGFRNQTIYDFVFDYDFTPLQRRAAPVRMRIDYSGNPNYWKEVVCKFKTPSSHIHCAVLPNILQWIQSRDELNVILRL